MKAGAGPVKLEVLKPRSDVDSRAVNAARLDTLEGKTICEVWATGGWRGGDTFPVIRELLQKRFPSTNFVPYTEFPYAVHSFAPYGIPLDKVGEVLKEKGCDAVLLGNGG